MGLIHHLLHLDRTLDLLVAPAERTTLPGPMPGLGSGASGAVINTP
ncbi:hypothetical protein [Streptomyces sp. NPDC058411]